MGEALESEIMGNTVVDQTKMKERRNGLWNIFDGVPPEVLETLGLTEAGIRQMDLEEEDSSDGDCLTQMSEPRTSATACSRCRLQRSVSASADSEATWLLQNRKRRNALGNLFEILSPSHQALLVEHLQAQLQRLSAVHANNLLDEGSRSSGDVCIATLTAASSVAVRSTSVTQGHIVCH